MIAIIFISVTVAWFIVLLSFRWVSDRERMGYYREYHYDHDVCDKRDKAHFEQRRKDRGE